MASQILPIPVTGHAPGVQSDFLSETPAVLVLDHDQLCISHCAEMLDELGYPHHCFTSSRHALEALGHTPAIRIVLANVQMPSIDGFALIEEARIRAGDARPIAAIVLAEQPTTELAIQSLRLDAVDFLPKPLAFDSYSGALRRARRYLADRQPAGHADVAGFGAQLSRLVAALESKTGEAAPDGPVPDKEIASTLRLIIGSRTLRARYFPGDLFADPAWDILLDLTRAALEKQQVSVSSVCIAASVPMSTALRWVRQMTDAGLLRRWTDPKDRRRDLIALTEQSASYMRDYLTGVHALLRKL
jgi:FixJ family two-component response regulator